VKRSVSRARSGWWDCVASLPWRRVVLAAALCGAFSLSGAVRAQLAGHTTVPMTGPAAQERSERTADDPVLVEVERIRRELADFAKRYRKAKGDDREALSRSVPPALEEIRARVLALGGSSGSSR